MAASACCPRAPSISHALRHGPLCLLLGLSYGAAEPKSLSVFNAFQRTSTAMARTKAVAPTKAKSRSSDHPAKALRKVIAPDESKDSDDRETSSSSDDEEPGVEEDTDDDNSSSSSEEEESEDSSDTESTASSAADCDDGCTVACLAETARLRKVCLLETCSFPSLC